MLALAYAALIVAVLVGSPLDDIDRRLALDDPGRHLPDLYPWIAAYVIVGQRAPSALVAAVYLGWRSWRERQLRPLIALALALVLLNVSVGAVKIGTGRLGPRLTSHARAVFDGGDIFPSGHASNAVVVFGVLALMARRHRRLVAAAAVAISGTVGLSTIFLDTHWFTDVVGGWLAGALVLLAVPPMLPPVERLIMRGIRLLRRGRRLSESSGRGGAFRRVGDRLRPRAGDAGARRARVPTKDGQAAAAAP